jgi:putative transposase
MPLLVRHDFVTLGPAGVPARLSERARRDGVLKTEIHRVFKDNLGVFSVREVWRQMRREGY